MPANQMHEVKSTSLPDKELKTTSQEAEIKIDSFGSPFDGWHTPLLVVKRSGRAPATRNTGGIERHLTTITFIGYLTKWHDLGSLLCWTHPGGGRGGRISRGISRPSCSYCHIHSHHPTQQSAQIQPLRGFDRLAAAGFSPEDIASMRRTFHREADNDFIDTDDGTLNFSSSF
jgi:hypothetical protein